MTNLLNWCILMWLLASFSMSQRLDLPLQWEVIKLDYLCSLLGKEGELSNLIPIKKFDDNTFS